MTERHFRILKQIPFPGIHASLQAAATLCDGPQGRLKPSRSLSCVRFEEGGVVQLHPEIRFFLARILHPGFPLDGTKNPLLDSLKEEAKPVFHPPVGESKQAFESQPIARLFSAVCFALREHSRFGRTRI